MSRRFDKFRRLSKTWNILGNWRHIFLLRVRNLILNDGGTRSKRGFAGREFLEKFKHFSHPTIDLLALLENGVLKSSHSFGIRCHVVPYSSFKSAFMVVEGEVLNDFPRFVGVLIAEFAVDGAVNLVLKMKGDMIIKNLDLKPTIDAMMRGFLDPSRWKELSKESDNKILLCSDGSCWKTFKPVASLITKEKLK
nr:hypothetical protein [Tanacetum cinerariifolium]